VFKLVELCVYRVMCNFSDTMTEELLEVHRSEILRLRKSYEQHKDMYDKLARRQKLWDEYLDLEVIFLCCVVIALLQLHVKLSLEILICMQNNVDI